MSFYVLSRLPTDVADRAFFVVLNVAPLEDFDDAKRMRDAFAELATATTPFVVREIGPRFPFGFDAKHREALDRYCYQGIHPGQFLEALLAADGFRALDHADAVSKSQIPAILSYIVETVPAAAFGSRESVRDWLGRDPKEAEDVD